MTWPDITDSGGKAIEQVTSQRTALEFWHECHNRACPYAKSQHIYTHGKGRSCYWAVLLQFCNTAQVVNSTCLILYTVVQNLSLVLVIPLALPLFGLLVLMLQKVQLEWSVHTIATGHWQLRFRPGWTQSQIPRRARSRCCCCCCCCWWKNQVRSIRSGHTRQRQSCTGIRRHWRHWNLRSQLHWLHRIC